MRLDGIALGQVEHGMHRKRAGDAGDRVDAPLALD